MLDTRFDFDEVIGRRQSDSEKRDKYPGRDILPLWVADTDFRAPPAVLDALHKRINHGIFVYARPPRGLVEAVCAHAVLSV